MYWSHNKAVLYKFTGILTSSDFCPTPCTIGKQVKLWKISVFQFQNKALPQQAPEMLMLIQSCTFMLCCMLGQLPLLQAESWHTDCLRARRTPSWTTLLFPQWCSATHPSEQWASQKVSSSLYLLFYIQYCCVDF